MLTCMAIPCQIRKIHQFLELINYSINWSPLFDFQPLKCYFLVEEKTKAILVLVFPKTDSKIIISFLIERKQDYFLFESPLNCIIVPHVKKSLNPVHTFGLTQRIWLRVSGSNNVSLSLSLSLYQIFGSNLKCSKTKQKLAQRMKTVAFSRPSFDGSMLTCKVSYRTRTLRLSAPSRNEKVGLFWHVSNSCCEVSILTNFPLLERMVGNGSSHLSTNP